MKLSELIFCITILCTTTLLGYFVLTTNPTFRLEDIALLKMFYVALLNVVMMGFILTLRGVREDILTKILSDATALAIFLSGYVIAVGMVIGK